MIVVIEQENISEHPELLHQMFCLRKRTFKDRLGWDVSAEGDEERDLYDDEYPVYVLLTDLHGKVLLGSLRLLPTTGPTLLQAFFADTLPDAATLSAPTIWECTRFCIDESVAAQGRRKELKFRSGALIAGLGAVAKQAGIETVLGNFEKPMLRIYRRIGCELEVLGCTHRYGVPVYLGAFHVSDRILNVVTERLRTLEPGSCRLTRAA
jgi:acyl homoserine lactone synthase